MKAVAVLNRESGALRSADLDLLCRQFHDAFARTGRQIELRICDGKAILDELEAAARLPGIELVIAGGGDGTVSAAAKIAMKHGVVLGILPAGTMNLFARSVGMPIDLTAAVAVLASAEEKRCDVAKIGDHVVIHQFSAGLQPRILEKRARLPYHGRVGKMLVSLRAAVATFFHPTWFRANLHVDGRPIRSGRFSNIVVSNNTYGGGHLPYADHLDRGELGIYWSRPLGALGAAAMFADVLLGRIDRNRDLNRLSGKQVSIGYYGRMHHVRCSIDGELLPLPDPTDIELHPGVLRVLAAETRST